MRGRRRCRLSSPRAAIAFVATQSSVGTAASRRKRSFESGSPRRASRRNRGPGWCLGNRPTAYAEPVPAHGCGGRVGRRRKPDPGHRVVAEDVVGSRPSRRPRAITRSDWCLGNRPTAYAEPVPAHGCGGRVGRRRKPDPGHRVVAEDVVGSRPSRRPRAITRSDGWQSASRGGSSLGDDEWIHARKRARGRGGC